MKDKIKGASKAHTVYKLANGTRVPGATTVTGLLNKPYLVKWANNLGLDGIDSSKYVDEAAKAGTLAHALVLEHLTGEKVDLDQFTAQQIDLAENSILSFFEWEKRHKIEAVWCERPMVSEKMKFGGTIDCLAYVDGELELIDFKTGKAVYEEYFVQTSAYRELLKENGFDAKRIRILRIGRDETEGFEERVVTDSTKYFKIFQDLLDIYYLKRELGWK